MAQFQNEASLTYDWNGRSPLSYQQFLQNKKYEQSIRFALDEQTRTLVGSNEQLARLGVAMAEGTAAGFEQLGDGLYEIQRSVDGAAAEVRLVRDAVQDVETAVNSAADAVRAGTRELSTALYWGFSNLLASQGRMNDSLEALVSIARTPAQTWAYEQFEIAKENNRRGLFPEALESVERAIGGFGAQTGYKTDFRFSMFLGLLRLGSYTNTSADIIDTVAAERAFLDAARFARSDHPGDAAQALICAGRAAFAQRANDRALDHTREGLALQPDHAQGRYQLAKILADAGQDAEATSQLSKAILISPELAVSAAIVGEFPDASTVRAAINHAIPDLKKAYADKRRVFERALAAVEGLEGSPDFTSSAPDLIPAEIARLKRTLATADAEFEDGSVMSIDSATRLISRQGDVLVAAVGAFRQRFEKAAAPVMNRLTEQSKVLSTQIDASNAANAGAKASAAITIRDAHSEFARTSEDGATNVIGCIGTFVVMILVTQVTWPLVGAFLPKHLQGYSTLFVVVVVVIAAPFVWGRIVAARAGAARSSAAGRAEQAIVAADQLLEARTTPLQAKLATINQTLDRIARRRREVEILPLPRAIANFGEITRDASSDIVRYSLTLSAVGAHKINVIKELRSIRTDLDLTAAKSLVDNIPATIVFSAAASDIDAIHSAFRNAGATVSIARAQ